MRKGITTIPFGINLSIFHSCVRPWICFVFVLFLCLLFGIAPSVSAQGQPQLVPLVTDQTPLPLSNSFGIAALAVVNQRGDYAFIGNGESALFFRGAGASAPVRVFQMGDEVPGFPGSRADLIRQPKINNSGLLAFEIDFFQANGIPQGIIFTYDGTSLHKIVFGGDPAPGGGGANFERSLNLIGINDAGDVAFTAPLVVSGLGIPFNITLYTAPAGGTPVRIAGLGDVAPGTGGTFFRTLFNNSFSNLSFNTRGEMLFRANITGGTGGEGFFIGSIAGGVRKIVAIGDPTPLLPSIPPGSFFEFLGTAFLNNAGQVAFDASVNVVGQRICVYTPVTGVAFAVSSGGSIGASALLAFDDAGDIAFTQSNSLFRYRPSNLPSNPTIETVALKNGSAPCPGGGTFQSIGQASINSTGTISFRSTLAGGSSPFGIFQQSSGLPTPVACDGQPVAFAGGGTYSLSLSSAAQTLDDRSVYSWAFIPGGAAYYAEFLISGGTTKVLMTTADPLPAGARVLLRTFQVGAGGANIGFLAFHSGGRFSMAVHNITSQATSVVATEGDTAAGTAGGIINSLSPNTVFVNASGTVAFSAQITGGSANGNSAIYLGAPGGGLTKVVASGDVDTATGKTFSNVQLNSVTPSSINDAGQVVFRSNLLPGNSQGVFVGSPGASPSKIAVVGDTTTGSGTITSFQSLVSLWINSSAQVVFLANTAAGPGIYIGSPGATPAKVAARGDAGPAGATFSSFATPGFNNNGQVAFVATLNGGPAGGVFLGSTSAPPVPLVLDGEASTAGGNFSITSNKPDVLINDEQDVVFRSNLTLGSSDSGYFVRRGPLGTIQAAVLQGQPAPGTSGVFRTFTPDLNLLVAGQIQLDRGGNVALFASGLESGRLFRGSWHLKTDNTLEPILVRGTVAPEFGGGAAVISTQATSWNSGARYPLWAGVSGGTFTDGIFLFVPPVSTNTPAGNAVPVTPTDATTNTTPVSMTFDSVVQAGATSLTTSSGGPAIPTAFALGNPPIFFNLATTAVFTGSITVCIDFSAISFPNGSNLRLLHFDGASWVDVTTSGPTGNIICGSVSSLSPFVVASVTVGFEFNALIARISNISGIPPGTAKSLLAKAQAAQASFNGGDKQTAQNQLNTLINELKAQSGKHLTASDAAILINEATDIINVLNH